MKILEMEEIAKIEEELKERNMWLTLIFRGEMGATLSSKGHSVEEWFDSTLRRHKFGEELKALFRSFAPRCGLVSQSG